MNRLTGGEGLIESAGLKVVFGLGLFISLLTLMTSMSSFFQPAVDYFPHRLVSSVPNFLKSVSPVTPSVPLGAQARTAQTAPSLEPLDLKLLGVLIPYERERARAVIQDLRAKRNDSYRMGDRLPREARLIQIKSDRVLVERPDGKKETLYVEEIMKRRIDAYARIVTPLSETTRLVNQTEVRKRALPLLLELSRVDVTPQVDQGRMLGFAVSGVSKNGLLNALGIEEGNIVSSINGKPLKNYREVTRLMGEALHSEHEVKVTLLKEGKQVSMTYYLQD